MSALRTSPLVVGTIRVDGLARFLDATGSRLDDECDIVEVRFDLASEAPEGQGQAASAAALDDLRAGMALDRCRALEAARSPVLATIRLKQDGGQWPAERDEDRLDLFRQVLSQEACSWVDIEVESAIAPDVIGLAHAGGRKVIVSHHDFGGTPEVAVLEAIIERGWRLGADLVKIATRVDNLRHHDHLVELLRRQRDREIAIIGMGPFGTALRTYLACVGSRLTYGFLDQVAAPGQISARDLVARLLTDCPAYVERRQKRGL